MTQNNEERRPVHQPNGVNENRSLPSSIGHEVEPVVGETTTEPEKDR